MGNLVMFFKAFDFDTKYDKNSATITRCNKIFDSKNKHDNNSTYWMMNMKKQNVEYSSWELNPNIAKIQIDILNHMKTLIVEAVKEAIGDDNVYKYYVPGFVKTGKPRHQMLHLDSHDIDLEFPWTLLIVHIPLEEKGQWLRLGKVVTDNNKEKSVQENPPSRTRRGKGKNEVEPGLQLNHRLIYIPFGSGVILPGNQLHAGHYGKEHNMRFHTVLSKSQWDGSCLLDLDQYILKNSIAMEGI